MLHIHFGAGRLGLGLVAPFFRKPDSELYLLNRAVSGANASGQTGLGPGRRNQLLRDHPGRHYFIRRPSAPASERQVVRYDRFLAFDPDAMDEFVDEILQESCRARDGVVVTASILDVSAYGPVVATLNALARARERGDVPLGRIYFVACENALNARDVFDHQEMGARLAAEARSHVTCVHALVDRICVGLEEDGSTGVPTVQVVAEEYGSLKLELNADTEPLAELCRGSRVEFSRHVEIEKQIKGWLLNGTHWLIALSALSPGQPPEELKLNEYINASEENRRFAVAALDEMGEGVAQLLRNDEHYAGFVRDVDVDAYLAGAREAILDRFSSTEDPITRILARFRAPTPEEHQTIEAFNRRFAERIDPPLEAYAAAHGSVPPAASQSLFNLHRLLASGHFVSPGRAAG